MIIKELNWRQFEPTVFRADISIKGLFGIRFEYGQRFPSKEYYYKYIVNGKKYGNYFGFPCKSLNEAKENCQHKYEEICSKIEDALFID